MKGGGEMNRIKTILRSARKKLGSRAGESIAETLVALLISAVAILMLASMITTSSDLIHRSTKAFDDYYAANNVLTDRAADAKTGTTSVSLQSSGSAVALVGNTTDDASISVDYYSNASAPSSKPVIAYKR